MHQILKYGLACKSCKIAVEVNITFFKAFCGLVNVKSFKSPSGLHPMWRFERFILLLLSYRQFLTFWSQILILSFLFQSDLPWGGLWTFSKVKILSYSLSQPTLLHNTSQKECWGLIPFSKIPVWIPTPAARQSNESWNQVFYWCLAEDTL